MNNKMTTNNKFEFVVNKKIQIPETVNSDSSRYVTKKDISNIFSTELQQRIQEIFKTHENYKTSNRTFL